MPGGIMPGGIIPGMIRMLGRDPSLPGLAAEGLLDGDAVGAEPVLAAAGASLSVFTGAAPAGAAASPPQAGREVPTTAKATRPMPRMREVNATTALAIGPLRDD